MHKLIVTNIMSIDGFYADVTGNPTVLNMDAAFDEYNLERMQSASTVLLGRASFEMFGSYWPHIVGAPEDPTNPALDATNREISRLYNPIPKLVVSDTLEVAADHPWHDSTEVISRADAVGRLTADRASEGADIVVYGSHILWNALLAEGLVDELHLMVSPGALGEGVPIFTAPTALELIEARKLDGSGNVLHVYAAA